MNPYFLFQIILISIYLGIVLVKHGEPKDENYNFFVSVLSAAFTIWLIWAGLNWQENHLRKSLMAEKPIPALSHTE